VLSQTKNQFIGQQYRISDLESGKIEPERLPLAITSAGNIYTFSRFKSVDRLSQSRTVDAQIDEQQDSAWHPLPPQKKQNTLYDLAKIEADNGAYQASLELIKQIPLDDPEYGKSRELKRIVFAAIEIQNSISSAREQVTKGNYQSAKILLENALARNPGSEELNRQLDLVEDKLDDTAWFDVLLNLLLLMILALLAFAVWRYPSFFLRQTAGMIGKTRKRFGFAGMESLKTDDKRDLRRQFVYKLDETRRSLNRAAIKDTDRRFKNTWMEMTARLNTMEKRARLNDTYLSEFLSDLEKILVSIARLVSQNERKSTFRFEKESAARPNREQESTVKPNRGNQSTTSPNRDKESTKKSNQQSEKTERKESEKPKQSEPQPKTPNYYEILGVSKNASLDEIKRAYRLKMKEYHPDRHNSSDFTWVKEEADRRTKLVQEAYTKLCDLLK
jgi:DnaJ-domain-containing protein 1